MGAAFGTLINPLKRLSIAASCNRLPGHLRGITLYITDTSHYHLLLELFMCVLNRKDSTDR